MPNYDRRGLFQRGENACQAALNQIEPEGISGGNVSFWARLAAWQGHFWINLGRSEEGVQRLNEVSARLEHAAWGECDTRFERALAIFFILLAKVRTENELVIAYARRSLELFQACGDRWYAARSLVHAGAALESLGRFNEQIQMAEQALALQTPDGDPELKHYIRYVLGCGYIYRGDLEIGNRIIDESTSAGSGEDERMEVAQKTIHKAVSLIFAGNYREALKELEFAFSIYHELGKPLGDENFSRYQATFLGLGDYQKALELVNQFTTTYGQSVMFAGQAYLMLGQNDLAQAILEKTIQAGQQTLNLRGIGLNKAYLSIAYFQNGEAQRAAELLSEVLLTCKPDSSLDLSSALLATSFFLHEQGDIEQALETYTAALKNPFLGKSAWTHDYLGKRIEASTEKLPAEAVAAARLRGQALSMQQALEQIVSHITQLKILDQNH